jgi:hypothetical protein
LIERYSIDNLVTVANVLIRYRERSAMPLVLYALTIRSKELEMVRVGAATPIIDINR